jgi:hypothetical protein
MNSVSRTLVDAVRPERLVAEQVFRLVLECVVLNRFEVASTREPVVAHSRISLRQARRNAMKEPCPIICTISGPISPASSLSGRFSGW